MIILVMVVYSIVIVVYSMVIVVYSMVSYLVIVDASVSKDNEESGRSKFKEKKELKESWVLRVVWSAVEKSSGMN